MLQIAIWAISKHSDVYNLATNVLETLSILQGTLGVNNHAAKIVFSNLKQSCS